MELDRYLEDLESRLDPAVEDELLGQWRTFCTGQWADDVFVPRRKKAAAKPIDWPNISVNQAMADVDKMMLSQFAGASSTVSSISGFLLNVRSNYGVPILAMPFGCELFVMPDEQNALPNCYSLGPEKARAWLDQDLPSVDHPYLQKVWEAGRRFMQIKRQYPKIGKYVAVYHPDFQGSTDILELIWGSEIFLAFVDEPQVVHRLLQRITDFYKACMRRWLSIVPNFDAEFSCHWGLGIPGQIMLRDDSAMNLSPEYVAEFMLPYDQQLLETFGGGTIHACGRVDHWTHRLAGIKGLRAFNMSQPQLNHVEKVLCDTVDKGILMHLDAPTVKALQAAGRKLHGKVMTCE